MAENNSDLHIKSNVLKKKLKATISGFKWSYYSKQLRERLFSR